MREKPRRTWRARWLAALVAAVFLVCGMLPVKALAVEGEPDAIVVPDEGYAFKNGTIWGISYEWLKSEGEKSAGASLDLRLQIPAQIDGQDVTTIGAHAFEGLTWTTEKGDAGAVNDHNHSDVPIFSIVEIDIEGSTNLTTIGTQAFQGCSEATGVLVMPDTLTEIVGNYAFRGCTGLTGVVWSNSLESLNGGRVEDGSFTSSAFSGCSGLRFATTKDSYSAAVNAGTVDNLCEVKFPETLKVIGGHTFEDAFAPGLSVPVWIPASVEYVGSEAFDNDSGTTPFKTIYVERKSSDSGSSPEFNGVTAYADRAFVWEGNNAVRVVVFPDSATREQFMENYDGFDSLKPYFTYEMQLNYMNGETVEESETKLYGLSVSYVKGSGSVWAADAGYALPDLPVEKPVAGDYWMLDGNEMKADTLVTSDEAYFHGHNDPVVTFVVELTPRSGSSITETYSVGDTVDLDLGTYVSARISAEITHPEYSPEKDDPFIGKHTYIYCQWHDSVTGESSLKGEPVFRSEWNYGSSRDRPFQVDETSHTRLGNDSYSLSVRILESNQFGIETPATDRVIYSGTGYNLHVNVIEPKPVLDWLVVLTVDGKDVLEEEWLQFLPDNSDEVINYMSETYDHAVAEDANFNPLWPSPAIETWSFDSTMEFNSAPGATNDFTWSVDRKVFEDAGWEIPAGFPLSGTVQVHNAYAIDVSAESGGSISPSGRVAVKNGAGQSFTITPDQGYAINQIEVDGNAINLSDVLSEDGSATYAFSDVTDNHTIHATFRSTGGGTVIPGVKHTITASAGEGGSISPNGRVTVADHGSRSFSITADEGYTVQNVFVDGVNVGPRGSYTFTDVTEDHTISVTFTEGNAPADPDESGVSEWFDTDNHNAYLHGYGDGTFFGPENAMTRAEAAQMFYNLLRDKSGGDRPVTFEDVPEDAFYAEPVRVLASLGMINGTSPTTYEPDRPITRAEFVAIAMRFSNGDVSGENIFTDVAEDAWYRDYVVGAVGYGWILGYQGEDATFGPDDPITRSQATTVANRMLGRVADGVWVAAHVDDLKLFEDVPQAHFAFRDIVEATNSHTYERDGRYESWTGLVE